ncbi:MAG: hypothetical protein QM687_16435 [Ferruginibacter sp.]
MIKKQARYLWILRRSQICVYLIAIILLNTGCHADYKKKQDIQAANFLETTFLKSINLTDESSRILYIKLEGDIADPATKVNASFFKPVLSYLYVNSPKLYSYIDEVLGKDSVRLVNESEKYAVLLYQEMKKYESDIIPLVPGRSYFFSQEHILPYDTLKKVNVEPTEFYELLFKNQTYREIKNNLLQLKLRVKNYENAILYKIFQSYTNDVIIHDEFPVPLITQSATVVQAGKELIITAGTGAYIFPYQEIQIGGKKVKPNERGFAEQRIKVDTVAGDKKVSVTIEIKNPDGTKSMYKNYIKYKVVKAIE